MDPNGTESLGLSQPTMAPSSRIYQILSKLPRRLCIACVSCDKGSVEGRTGLIRRYIPNGDRMDKCSVHC